MNYNLIYKDSSVLKLKHPFEAGFYSNCTIILCNIIKYYNEYKYCPEKLDTTECLKMYKNNENKDDDIRDHFFKEGNLDILIDYNIKCDDIIQFDVYKDIKNIQDIIPFVKKYFNLSEEVLSYVELFEKKYNIDYDNTCVLFYRGNDKIIETSLGNYQDFVNRALDYYNKDNNIKFLIQSDETDFIEYCVNRIPNCFFLNDEIRHIRKNNSIQLDFINIHTNTNNMYAKKFLAILHIISKCKYLIMNSGNISFWIYLFKMINNTNNVHNTHQYLLDNWYN